jgi:hypothetical protein
MGDIAVSETRYAPAIPLPPYGYVPGHGLPHPVNDPAGHLFGSRASAHEQLVSIATLAENVRWPYALDLFNSGFYWEAHEVWESFWNAFGRTTSEAKFVQGLIHLAAAALKIREGKPTGVTRHTKRSSELLGDLKSASVGGTLALEPESIAAVVAELEGYTPACWHTSRTPAVRVLSANLRLAD